jgi:hypothetical protein
MAVKERGVFVFCVGALTWNLQGYIYTYTLWPQGHHSLHAGEPFGLGLVIS